MNDGDRLEAIRKAYTELGRVVDAIDWRLLEFCDCGHRRIEHLAPQHHPRGESPCLHGDCSCRDFDTLHQRGELWIRRERERRQRRIGHLTDAERRRRGEVA